MQNQLSMEEIDVLLTVANEGAGVMKNALFVNGNGTRYQNALNKLVSQRDAQVAAMQADQAEAPQETEDAPKPN